MRLNSSGSRSGYFVFIIAIVFAITMVFANETHAGWRDFLDQVKEKYNQKNNSKLSDKDIIEGLKEALRVGTKKSINILGKKDGYYKDTNVKILMPDNLLRAEKILRRFGGDKIADDFIKTMNRAAEKAVQSTVKIFIKAIKEMTIKDAVDIYKGRNDEATRYFKRTQGGTLKETILPIVKDATKNTGVTSSYKKLVSNIHRLHLPIDDNLVDLDQYITQKTMDGIFYKLAKEEGQIRTNPKARTTEILKRVFAN